MRHGVLNQSDVAPSASIRSTARMARARLDLAGVLLAAGTVVWTFFAANIAGGSPGPFVALVLASASALVIGRLVASVRPSLVPATIVAAATILAVTTPDVLSSFPLSGPFGYTNAKGAFFVQAAIAGLMVAVVSRSVPVRVFGLAAAIAFGVVPFAAESMTGAALLILPLAALATRASAGGRTAVLGCAVVFLIALMATIAIGSTYDAGDRSGSVNRVVDSTLTERRAALWHEALLMMRDQPFTGVGPGRFQALSPTANFDRDARWAHNSFLQNGAETGAMGLLLLVLLFMWGFGSLGANPTPDNLSVLAAAAIAALGIHASVDYVLHFPAVPLTTAALVGAASIGRQRVGRESS